jgi:hypothetical protein
MPRKDVPTPDESYGGRCTVPVATIVCAERMFLYFLTERIVLQSI